MAAEIILSAFLPVILEKLISPAIQQIGVAFGTNNKLKKLERILESIQPVLVDAEERQTDNISVKNWLSSLKNAAYEAEDILEDFYLETERKVPSCCSVYKSAKTFGLRKRLNDIIRKIEAIADEIHRFNFHLNKVPRISCYGRPQTHSYVDKETVIGREKDKEDIVSCLINHAGSNTKNIMVLPIFAMGGMGKTTLSQLIYRDVRVETLFQLCIWVCVSDADFDVARLVRLIIEAATKKECKVLNMELLQDRLREIISRNRYLIVLDDVWNENPDEWNRLKMLLDCGGVGSSVLVTTRSMIAAKIMATHNIHELKQLAEEDSWELFRRKAFAEGAEEPVSLVKIGKDIIKRCGGLPLAIDTLGSMMRLKNDEEEWKAVLDSEIWKMRAAEDSIMSALRLSYNYLPSHLKQCFTFCAIYPKDYVMEKDILIQLWMANGYIPTDEKGDLEINGREIFDELVWRSFFQNVVDRYGGKVTCKMHDLMHDLAQCVMGKECLNLPEIGKWEDIPPTTKHLRIEYFPELRIPVLQNPRTIRTIIHPRGLRSKDTLMLKSLRALSLLDNSMHFNKQVSIRHLRHLRWLDMSDTRIEKFPEDLCSLYYLQTLNLSNCSNLKKLPDNLTDLVNLRHLYTDGCSSLVCMPRKMVRLKQLRTLTMYIVSDEAERGIEQLHDLNLYGKLQICGIEKVTNAIFAEKANLLSKPNLRSITLSLGNANSLEVFTALKPHNGLTMLEVLNYGGEQFPGWMDVPQQLQNLVEMKLKHCTKCKELPLLLGQLPSLKFLELVGMDDIKHIISKTSWQGRDLPETLFPSLNKLKIIDMKNLDKWWEEEGSNHRSFLPQLKQLVINNCEKLTIIPSLSQIQDLHLSDCQSLVHLPPCLPSVRNLIINQCNSLESLPEPGNNLPELQILMLYQCDGLASLPQMMESVNNLDISKCNQLTSLPEGLSNLRSLILEQCHGLLYLPSDLESLVYLTIINCDGLVSLLETMEEGLTQLQSLVISKCHRLTSLPMGLTKLNTLVLEACDGLASLPEGMEGLTQLQHLTISDCNRVRSLPEGLQQRLPYLKSLRIGGHDELIRWFQLGGDYWHLIVNISDRTIL